MLRRAVREHRRRISQIICDIITLNIHRRFYTSMLRTSPMCLGNFKPLCTSPNIRRLLCAARWYISDDSWRRNIGRKQWRTQDYWKRGGGRVSYRKGLFGIPGRAVVSLQSNVGLFWRPIYRPGETLICLLSKKTRSHVKNIFFKQQLSYWYISNENA